MIKFSYIVLINERPRDMIVLRLVSLSYKITEEKGSCILRLQNIDSSYKVTSVNHGEAVVDVKPCRPTDKPTRT